MEKSFWEGLIALFLTRVKAKLCSSVGACVLLDVFFKKKNIVSHFVSLKHALHLIVRSGIVETWSREIWL